LREYLEMAVEDDGKKGIRLWFEDFMYAAVTLRLLYIRCQNTTCEDWESLGWTDL
jgi:hypothetical protein